MSVNVFLPASLGVDYDRNVNSLRTLASKVSHEISVDLLCSLVICDVVQ